jgi:hypothetical protein
VRKIELLSVVGDFAEDKDRAASIRDNEIRPALADGQTVTLDFTGITLATQSFVHALISDILRSGGEAVLEKVEFHGCAPGVRGIVETVVQYSLETMEDAQEERKG